MKQRIPKVVSVVEQGWNLLRKMADSVSLTTRCSKVQDIVPILQKGNAYRMYDSEATRHVSPHPISRAHRLQWLHVATACRVGSATWGKT